MPSLLYADDLVFCDESKEGMRVIVGRFTEVCRRRGLKVNAGKSKEMVLNGEGDSRRCVLDESGTDDSECRRKAASGRRIGGVISFVVNARCLQLESCMRISLCLFLCMAVRQ